MFPLSRVLNLHRAILMNRRLDLIALAEAIEIGVMCGIDVNFGGKGKPMDVYRKAMLGDDGRTPLGADGMTDAARSFFELAAPVILDAQGNPLIPVVRKPVPREEHNG